MSLSKEDKELTNHLIDLYRELLEQRYTYSTLKYHFSLPDEVNENTVDEVKAFFLQHLYPPTAQREQLDKAFESLKYYVANPLKVWGLLGNMAAAIFRFGTQFPAALKAGFYSLEAFTDARKFEQKLLKASKKLNYQIPLSHDDLMKCLAEISRKEAEGFINDIGNLFLSMSDTILLRKTLAILKDVVETMKKKPNLYPAEDVRGIELGMQILEHGLSLFSKMNRKTKKKLRELIRQNEMLFLDEVHTIK